MHAFFETVLQSMHCMYICLRCWKMQLLAVHQATRQTFRHIAAT